MCFSLFHPHNSDREKFVQLATLSPVHQAQVKPVTWIQRLSCSENALFATRSQEPEGGLLSLSLQNFNMEATKETRTEEIRGRWVSFFF
jgi:hypothetical protein